MRGAGSRGWLWWDCRTPAVKESTDRVWTALINSGFYPPDGRTDS